MPKFKNSNGTFWVIFKQCVSKEPSRLDTPWIFCDHQMTTCKVVLSEPVGLGHWWVKMAKLLSIISILVTSFCIGFLILMGTKCVVKLSEELKGTNVDIVKASKHLYPTITICSIDAHSQNERYIQMLDKCNLRYNLNIFFQTQKLYQNL